MTRQALYDKLKRLEPVVSAAFVRYSAEEFAATLVELARRINPNKYRKHKRGPKRKPPKKPSGKTRHHHLSARLLAMRR